MTSPGFNLLDASAKSQLRTILGFVENESEHGSYDETDDDESDCDGSGANESDDNGSGADENDGPE